jgi:hypothetical protein
LSETNDREEEEKEAKYDEITKSGMYEFPERTVIRIMYLPFKEHGCQSLTVCDDATSMESHN